jgi:cytochrome P450
MAQATLPIVTLTPEEAAERRRAVDSALGSLRIEGMELEQEPREILERFARGETDLAAMHAQMDAYAATIA